MASTYLSRTPTSNSASRTAITVSMWIKRGQLGALQTLFHTTTSNSGYLYMALNVDDQIDFALQNTSYTQSAPTGFKERKITNRKLRDTNGWYHIVCTVDTSLATATDRLKIYINGEQETSWSHETNNTQQNQALPSLIGSTSYPYNIGRQGNDSYYYDGSIAHFHYIDGTAYAASTFGETDSTTGIWEPKTAPSVSYGTNGFFLKFENSGSMGTDSSGNSNNFTVNGSMTQLIDTPSNVFATLNPIATSTTAGSFSNSNTTHTKSNSTWASTTSTLAASSGKYYAEYKFTANSSSSNGQMAAIVNMDLTNYMNENSDLEQNGNKGITYYPNGTVFADPQTTVGTYSSYGDAIIQIAMDLDNGFLYFGKDGTWQNSGDPTSGATGTGGINISNYIGTGTYAFGLANRNTGSTSVNFGNGYFGTTAVSSAQNPDDGTGIFEYDVPAGYRALCTKSINAEEYS